jgi:hypothetical protein
LIDHYDWPGGREAMLRFGPDTGPVVVAALPLFEEANRTRAFVITILRALAERGIAGGLPDLPGQSESLVSLETVKIMQMRDAYQAVVDSFERPVYALGIRSGALLDTLALVNGRWHFAPQDGAELLRELKRIRQTAVREALGDSWWAAEDVTEIGGNRLSIDLLSELTSISPFEEADLVVLRTVRLESDPKPADLKVPGAPLWRRSEPDNDAALAALLADDIAAWVRACEG